MSIENGTVITNVFLGQQNRQGRHTGMDTYMCTGILKTNTE